MHKIEGGTEIPNKLWQAREDGKVIFFCGSGISCSAKLPVFKGLVKKVYKRSNLSDPMIEIAITKEEYDSALGLIEMQLSGGAIRLRKIIKEVLSEVDYEAPNAKVLHSSILKLSKSKDGIVKLVTTNCDRIFEDTKVDIPGFEATKYYAAPFLPVSKKHKWNGIVYLHGLLSKDKEDEESLGNLVFTSGDFGLAYLTERWASRFLTGLFRDYTICFVGYSLNDTILRYMVDALAADSVKGEKYNKPYVFAENKDNAKMEWMAKKVIPVLYDNSSKDHSILTKIFKRWSDSSDNGLTGNQSEILRLSKYVLTDVGDQDNDTISSMLWALMEKTGKNAECFANINPVPPITWLDVFSNPKYEHLYDFASLEDLSYINRRKFSLLSRSASSIKAPRMSLLVNQKYSSLDNVNIAMAKWLSRHLNDPKLIEWLIESKENLHPTFKSEIKKALDNLKKLTKENKEELLRNAPNAYPDDEMSKIWRFILNGQILFDIDKQGDYENYESLLDEYNESGLSFGFIEKLRKLLSPKIKIKKKIIWDFYLNNGEDEEKVYPKFDLNVYLPNFEYSSMFNEISGIKDLDLLVFEFQQILKDTLSLYCYANPSSDCDLSYFNLKSIEPHWQNKHFSDNWTSLIELLRDSWLKVLEKNIIQARDIALTWFDSPYLSFKRLALYASTKCNAIQSSVWLTFILKDNALLLWDSSARREILRLLFLEAKNLNETEFEILENAIRKGPPRAIFKEGISQYKLTKIRKRFKIHYLAKLKNSSCKLSEKASTFFEKNKAKFEYYTKVHKHDEDEFLIWSSSSGDPGHEESKIFESVPEEVKALGVWIKKSVKDRYYYKDNFKDICNKNPMLVIRAFLSIKKGFNNENLRSRLIDALYTWKEDKYCVRLTWLVFSRLSRKISIEKHIDQRLSHSLSLWLKEVAKNKKSVDDKFIDLSKIILGLNYNEEMKLGSSLIDTLTNVINNPTGIVSKSLVRAWLNTSPVEKQGISERFKVVFTELATSRDRKFIYAKEVLGEFINTFYYFDEEWTKQYLLPLLNFSNDFDSAKVMWIGFFCRNQVNSDVLYHIKEYFKSIFYREELKEKLGTSLDVKRENELNEDLRENAIELLLYCWLNNIELFSEEDPPEGIKKEAFRRSELSELFQIFTLKDYEHLSCVLNRVLSSLEDSKDLYWRKTIRRFFKKYWSGSNDIKSSIISNNLSRICLELDDSFNDAIDTLIDSIGEVDYNYSVVYHLKDKKLNEDNVESALKLLAKACPARDLTKHLTSLLSKIKDIKPCLVHTSEYRKLQNVSLNS